jgi:site-specific recombinase XerD
MNLFITDLRLLRCPGVSGGVPPALPHAMIEAAMMGDLVDGMPFILDDNGAYDLDLNRFFRACPTMGVRSMHSVKAYARDILTWLHFLKERCGGKTVWQADREDVAAYHAARRLSAVPHRISAASWNRNIAALEKLYRWGVEEELILATPFTYRHVWGGGPYGMMPAVAIRSNRAREPAARPHDMRFVDLERYLLFRDVGLRGRLPDGLDDPSWRGRNGERNALFAELLVTTGLRLEEASSLLRIELPSQADRHCAGQRLMAFRLPAAIAKGNKGREVRLPLRLLRRLNDYAELERANAVAIFAARMAGSELKMPVTMSGADRHSVLIDDGDGLRRVRLDLLAPERRSRLICRSHNGAPEPALLWLTEAGLPVAAATWESIFRRASLRCRDHGIDIDVSPHSLRHTFAVHMLEMLIREQIGAVLDSRNGTAAGAGDAAYRRMIGDPLQKLQRLMGHASIASTYIYLDSLEESRALVDAAVTQWDADLASAGGR